VTATGSYLVGLDLGQVADPSALAVLERTPFDDGGGRPLFAYDCVHLHRFRLGTPYPGIVRDVAELTRRPELAPAGGRRPVVAVDATGVGRPVVDMILSEPMGAEPVAISITAGSVTRWDTWPGKPARAAWVPKRDLISTVRTLLDGRRLTINSGLAQAGTLRKELFDFQAKLTAAAHETFGAWREGAHDDLVLAVALAAWLGEYAPNTAGSYRVGFTPARPAPPMFVPGGSLQAVGRDGPSVYVPRAGDWYP
jgi:hypothetical protein